MRRTVLGALTAAVALGAVGCASTSTTKYVAYGDKMTLADREQVPVEKVLASPDQYKDKTILVSGTVSEVCVHKGCWIKVAEKVGGDSLFVKFVCPVEGRLIPVDAVGQAALVEGTLIVENLSEGEARHYAEDAGKSKAEIEKIVGPQKWLRLKAPSARVAAKPAASATPEKS